MWEGLLAASGLKLLAASGLKTWRFCFIFYLTPNPSPKRRGEICEKAFLLLFIYRIFMNKGLEPLVQ